MIIQKHLFFTPLKLAATLSFAIIPFAHVSVSAQSLLQNNDQSANLQKPNQSQPQNTTGEQSQSVNLQNNTAPQAGINQSGLPQSPAASFNKAELEAGSVGSSLEDTDDESGISSGVVIAIVSFVAGVTGLYLLRGNRLIDSTEQNHPETLEPPPGPTPAERSRPINIETSEPKQSSKPKRPKKKRKKPHQR